MMITLAFIEAYLSRLHEWIGLWIAIYGIEPLSFEVHLKRIEREREREIMRLYP